MAKRGRARDLGDGGRRESTPCHKLFRSWVLLTVRVRSVDSWGGAASMEKTCATVGVVTEKFNRSYCRA